jgi:uncharacterized protein YjbI with pentapeptide repeats
MAITADPALSSAPASGSPAGDAASWIEQLQGAVEAASAEARSAFFYYAGFGLYFAIAVAGTSHEDLLRGATVTMPGLGIGMPLVGFYVVVPLLFVVFHVYVLLQLVVLARRIGWLKVALKSRPEATGIARQRALISPFAISQRLFGEPRGLVPRAVLSLSIWLTLVLIPLALLLATQLRFLPYHAAGVTWAHRLYIAFDALLLLLLWPVIIHPGRRGALGWLGTVSRRVGRRRRSLAAGARAGAEAVRRRLLRWRRTGAAPARLWTSATSAVGALTRGGVALLALFVAFVVATVPGEAVERALLSASAPGDRAGCTALWRVSRWLDTVRLPDRRTALCVTYGVFDAPETPLGLRRNMMVRDASLVALEPSRAQIAEPGAEEAWRSKGEGVNLQGRDLRFADLSGSDLRLADLRGANLKGAVLQGAKLTASRAGDIPRVEVGVCPHQSDDASETCVTGLVDADLRNADLRELHGWKIDLQGANLTGAQLQDAVLEHARLDGSLLTWAHLDRARLDGATLTGAVLREASAPKVRLNAVDAGYAFLRQADLGGAELIGMEVERADLDRITIDGATCRPGESHNCYLRGAQALGRWDAYFDLPAVAYHERAAMEMAVTVSLFEHACHGESALSARGVVQRLWHEFDYSRSHDEAGYAPVANLRYLLARLILSPDRCPGVERMPEGDVDQLQKLLSEWCIWREEREDRDKAIEPDLERSWSDLTLRLGATGQADDIEVADIWARLDAETADQQSCPEMRQAGTDGD